ncbi:hypothetical protein M8818_004052 [Zalaria obscura]|uniref:Uncharacterized protein n=1 Tax=Zalaria obscura TaxID=2024903 RepID=A0ACC3SDQ3_9PEZI
MRFSITSLLVLFQLCSVFTAAQQQWPLHNDGQNDVVQWDHYSVIINGERIFIWSGEMHYWRIPVPELWVDVLQKVKAAGFNCVSFYAHWGFHSPSDGKLDFENGAHNFTSLFTIAKDLGLYILFRPGPYINAETTAGGFPGWLTTGDYGTLRNNDTRYTAAWTPYFDRISEIVGEHAVTRGGNVFLYQIENEYGEQWTDAATRTPNETAIAYMELLEAAANRSGINIPTIHNNPNLGTLSWSMDYDINHVGGDTDLYGLDHYPSCWSCNLEECTSVNGALPDFTLFDYYTNFQEAAPTQPSFFAEFQGGAYNPWNGPAGGCVSNTGPSWVNVFYRHNIGQKVTAQNIYMVFGGTNWGGLAFPSVGTSYDYSAPISESRLLGDKYSELKLLSYFIRAAKELTMVERAGNGTNFTNNAAVFTQVLENVQTHARFYVTVHTNSTLETQEHFKLNVSTSLGTFMVPQYATNVLLNGRQSKILLSDFSAGSQKIVYSTAEVMAVSTFETSPTIVFWVPTGESGEFYLEGAQHGSVMKCQGCSSVGFHQTQHGVITSFTQGAGFSVFKYGNGVTAIIADRTAAYTFWQPTLTNDPHVPLNSTILVAGPHLIRTAEIDGDTLALTGDYNTTTPLEVFIPSTRCTHLTFNGNPLSFHATPYGSIIAHLTAPAHTIASINATLPILSTWKVADGLPERLATYNDTNWVLANHTRTSNPNPPATYPVLYADEYGFHTGPILWRGRFSGAATGVFLNVIGGTSSGWSAWLNGVWIGSSYGNVSLAATNATLDFPGAAVKSTGENVLLVLQDNMGHDETTGVLNPRGIANATLIGGGGGNGAGLGFSSWRVQGNAGGEKDIDPVRGPLNEGGLHAERLGWHLPGFDDGDWAVGSPEEGFGEAGARFYRTVVPLRIPEGVDVSLAFELGGARESRLRAQLYVNGYQFGKRIPWVGNQVEFPVFPGILNYK